MRKITVKVYVFIVTSAFFYFKCEPKNKRIGYKGFRL